MLPGKVIHRGGQVMRVLVPSLDGNQKWTRAAKVRKVLFADKRKGHAVVPGNR
jgi:hypothetical protein